MHRGPYTHASEPGLQDAHATVRAWAEERGIALTEGGCTEQYLVGPVDEPDYARWETEIAYLVEQRPRYWSGSIGCAALCLAAVSRPPIPIRCRSRSRTTRPARPLRRQPTYAGLALARDGTVYLGVIGGIVALREP